MGRDEAAEVLARSAIDLGPRAGTAPSARGGSTRWPRWTRSRARRDRSWSVQDAGADRGNGRRLDGGELAALALVARDTRDAGPARATCARSSPSVTPGVVVHRRGGLRPDRPRRASATSCRRHVLHRARGCGPTSHSGSRRRAGDGAPGATTDLRRAPRHDADDDALQDGRRDPTRVDRHRAHADGKFRAGRARTRRSTARRCRSRRTPLADGRALGHREQVPDRLGRSRRRRPRQLQRVGPGYLKSPRIDATGTRAWTMTSGTGSTPNERDLRLRPVHRGAEQRRRAELSWCKSIGLVGAGSARPTR